MDVTTKNKYPEAYGYQHPWDIPGDKVYYVYFIDGDGDKRYVPCTKEFFYFYRNELSEERRKRRLESRCLIPSPRYHCYKICMEDCSICNHPRYKRTLSLDKWFEDNEYELPDPFGNSAEDQLYQEWLLDEIRRFMLIRDEVDNAIYNYFDESDSSIGRKCGKGKSVIQYRRTRLIRDLREYLEINK